VTGRVVCFHYFYPPLGGVAARRAAGLTRHVGSHGWQPIVLTPADGHYYEDPGESGPSASARRDPTRAAAAATAAPAMVRRTGTIELSRWARLVGRRLLSAETGDDDLEPLHVGRGAERLRSLVRNALYIPDAQVGWLPFAVRAGMRAVRSAAREASRHGSRGVALYSSSFPITSHLAALVVSRRTRRPWIAEFRDLWTRNHLTPRQPGPRRRIDEAIERRIVAGADLVVTVTEDWRRELIAQFPDQPSGKFRVLPNGYEPGEFAASAAVGPDPDRFRLVYVGTMYGDGQDPSPLFQALHALARQGVVAPEQLVLEIVGRPHAPARALARQSGVEHLVQFSGLVSHDEAIARQMSGDLLVVILDPANDRLRGCIPGKVFEYLAAGRPILGIVPPGGETAALLRAAGNGQVVDGGVTAIQEAVAAALERWRSGRRAAGPSSDVVERFRYDRLAGTLAGWLDELAGEHWSG
jgi:glycosyltransferase involved in cell wall biosynthesis